MRIGFAGTPEFARVALEQIHAAGARVEVVLTQPDRPAGRGLHLQASPVKAFALAHGFAVLQPRSLRLDGKFPDDAAAAAAALRAADLDVLVVAAYGLILPAWVLAAPRLGCINIHASLLPRWRGAAPIHRAVEAGDARTGITIMQMDAGLDTGAMLLSDSLAIAANDTTGSLHDRLAQLGGRLIVQALEQAGQGGLTAVTQPTDGVSYAHKIDKAEAAIDWAEAAEVIERRVRAFDPFPVAQTTAAGEVIRCWRAELAAGSGAPGEVLAAGEHGVEVACGTGALRLTELQRAGGKRLPAPAFLQGKPLAVGTVLGSSAPR
jgi:methionyl-tRNA formyltransferase